MGRAKNKIRVAGGGLQRTDRLKIRRGKAIGKPVESASEIVNSCLVPGGPQLEWFSWGWPINAGAADRRPNGGRSVVLSFSDPEAGASVQASEAGERKAA